METCTIAARQSGRGRFRSNRNGKRSESCDRVQNMRYHVMTEVSPEDVLQRAREFYTEHARVEVDSAGPDGVRIFGEIGTADIEVDRHHGHTNVHARTDRPVGLDITDLTKRFLYSLGHI